MNQNTNQVLSVDNVLYNCSEDNLTLPCKTFILDNKNKISDSKSNSISRHRENVMAEMVMTRSEILREECKTTTNILNQNDVDVGIERTVKEPPKGSKSEMEVISVNNPAYEMSYDRDIDTAA